MLCPSQATICDLVAEGFDDSLIRHVPWGVEASLVTEADRTRVTRTHDLPSQFVLFVGTIEPRKNLAGLAAAVRGLDLPLVAAGADGWGDAGSSESDVQFLGFVDDADLPALYSLATVFAYPSLSEGFGLPVAEAMAYGTPVVTSRGTSTEEVAGGAAVLVEPTDFDSISAGLREALDRAPELVALGSARAAQLSWGAAADATVAAYREVAA